jgi:membrane protein YdbS with pleckstrin-like domain
VAGDDAVFSLTVSQWDNFWKFIILLTFLGGIVFVLWFFEFLKPYREVASLGALVFTGFIGWYHYLVANHTRVFVRPLRVDTEKGILSKKLDSLELFRITDVELKQNFVERLLGIGTVFLMTTDSSSEPELILYQVPRAKEVYKYLQTQIPLAARQRGAIYMEK